MPYTNIICIVGAGGTGKDTLAQGLVARLKEKGHLVLSETTRPMREGEHDGLDYHFVTDDEFVSTSHIEEREYRGWHYGIPYGEIMMDKMNVAVVDVCGAISLKEYADKMGIPIICIYLETGGWTRLARMIKREGMVRFEHFRRHYSDTKDFSYAWEVLSKIFSGKIEHIDTTYLSQQTVLNKTTGFLMTV